MIKSWFSGLTLIVQILLVVAAVLIFAWFDPFDIFMNTKLSIRDTPSRVKEIKEIGELITAEYCGEVISSFYNVQQQEAAIKKNRLQLEVENLDSTFAVRLKAVWKIDGEKEQLQQFNNLCDKLDDEQRFFDIYFKELKKEVKLGFFQGRKAFLEKLYDYDFTDEAEANKRIAAIMNDKEVKKIGKKEENINPKKQLILLARGKVQAGFKFEKLNEKNVRVDTLHNRIVLVGFSPEILSCTINPWFIPELGIKGFEIIDMTGKADEVKIFNSVKRSCEDSLKMKAIQSGILEKAVKNAETNLQNFFSIIMNNKDIKVSIVPNELAFYSTTLLSNNFITLREIAVMDTVLNKYWNNTYTDEVANVLTNLSTKKLVCSKDTINLSKPETCDSLFYKYFSNKPMLAYWQKNRSHQQ